MRFLQKDKGDLAGGSSLKKKKISETLLLKKVFSKHGTEILKNPETFRKLMISEEPESQIFAAQTAMFLEATHCSGILLSKERFEVLGQAGYESILIRGMKDTGLTYKSIKNLWQHLVTALGYEMEQWKLPELPEGVKLPLIKEENGVIRPEEGEARGQKAYECAVMWLKSDSRQNVRAYSISLTPSMSQEAVWARKYLERAVNDGCHEAYRLLGLCCYYGVGKEKNDEEAFTCLVRSDGYTAGKYLTEAKKVLMELLEQKKQEKKKRVETQLFSAMVILCMAVVGVFLHPEHLAFFLLAGLLQFGASGYCLFVRESSQKKRNISACTSLILWCFLVLRICW